MDTFFIILRKLLVGTIALVFAFVIVYVPQHHNNVPEAHAQLVVTDPGNTAVNFQTSIQTTLTAVKENVLDNIAFILAKTMISQILQSTITWINNGFEGSPAFIQDINRFLLDVADEAAGEFIQGLGGLGSFICEPFRLDIQLALALKYQEARGDDNNGEDSCRLSDIVDNLEAFYEGELSGDDFWNQWVTVTANPEAYTPYGQFMAAEGRLNARLVNARGQELTLANWGNGFLSSKVCETIEGPNGADERCVISTPGRVISDQLNKVLGVGQDQLVAADEINEVISALLGQIAKQALTGAAGLLGLSVNSGGTSGGSGSFVSQGVAQIQANTQNFFESRYAPVREKLQIQQEYLALANEYIPKLQAFLNLEDSNPRFTNMTPQQIQDLRSRARIALSDAQLVRSTSERHMTELRSIILQAESIQTQLNNPNLNEYQKQDLMAQFVTILEKGNQYNAYTEDRILVSEQEWSDIVGS